METIYWIQRLGAINTIAWVFFVLSIVATFIFCIIAVFSYEYRDDEDTDALWYKIGIRGLKTTPWAFSISMLICIFIPSEKDLYIIYGVGGTIDYIKSNESTKKLPDKVVNALDAWLDNQTDNNNNDE